MGSLDFAFLAEFAKAEPFGTLTAVGAGLYGVRVATPTNVIPVFVAGRVRQEPGTSDSLEITIESPNREYSLEQSIDVVAPEKLPNEDLAFATTVFAVQVQIPAAGEGRYVVSVKLGDSSALDIDLWIKLPDGLLTTPEEEGQQPTDPRSGD